MVPVVLEKWRLNQRLSAVDTTNVQNMSGNSSAQQSGLIIRKPYLAALRYIVPTQQTRSDLSDEIQ